MFNSQNRVVILILKPGPHSPRRPARSLLMGLNAASNFGRDGPDGGANGPSLPTDHLGPRESGNSKGRIQRPVVVVTVSKVILFVLSRRSLV